MRLAVYADPLMEDIIATRRRRQTAVLLRMPAFVIAALLERERELLARDAWRRRG
jgi:hypothetical protein